MDNQDVQAWIRRQGQQGWYKATLTIESFRRLSPSREQLAKTLQVALTRLDSKAFGNAFKRHGKRSLRLPVFGGEVQTDTHSHYHMLIAKPAHLSDVDFRHLLSEAWNYAVNESFAKRAALKQTATLHGATWVDVLHGATDEFIAYMLRYEGTTFSAGSEKVDLENAVLQ